MAKSLLASLAAVCLGLATPARAAAAQTAYDFAFTTIDGAPLPLSDFRGKVLLVVNTASRCGFTPQYEGLEKLWTDYRDRGLVVLGVPSNDFGGQEPGTETQIKEFCQVNFAVDFPMTAKTVVRGDDAHPFYRWAAMQVGPLGVPHWNFHKYLVAPDGRLVDWFATTTSPDAGRLRDAVQRYLPEAATKR